jgi:hypothetical protein
MRKTSAMCSRNTLNIQLLMIYSENVRFPPSGRWEPRRSHALYYSGVQMCNSYAKTPEDLVFKWQSICINQRTGVTGGGLRPLDSTGVLLMKKEFQKGIQVMQARKAGNVNARKPQGRTQPRQSLPQAIRQPLALVKSEANGFTLHDKLDERRCRCSIKSSGVFLPSDRSIYARTTDGESVR